MKEAPHNDIKTIAIVDEMKTSYLDYAMSVIVSRALPDARDGLKPVHRRILFAMYESGCHHNKPYKKSARIVGEVMGKYHPHGDSAIYDSLVRMAQEFSLRLPLIDGQGNFGSIDNDSPAAMRYTESRLEKIAHTMLEDIDKETVTFIPNYDGSEHEPAVLPTRFPNLYANGSEGIAVGMATSIPPHNLGELLDATIAIIHNHEITIDELMLIVPAPDFPTGAHIIRNSGIAKAMHTGHGQIKIRSKATVDTMKNGKGVIILTELPYQVVKSNLIQAIADLVKEKKIDGITEIRDESNKDGIRVVIETRRDANSDVILNQIYKFTQAELNFSANILALHHGKPESMNLKKALVAFIDFRSQVITKRTQFLLNKVKDKAHILIGLCVAVDFIDEVVRMIRASKDTAEAKATLLASVWNAEKVVSLISLVSDKRNAVVNNQFKFTEEQVRAILEMRLSKLTGLEKDSIIKELEVLVASMHKYTEILMNREVFIKLMIDELIEVKEKFATPRKSEILDDADEIDMESLIAQEDIVVSFTENGYIKRLSLSTYNTQKRGGKGKVSMKTNEEDTVSQTFLANTHTNILFFTNIGRVYKLKGYRIPEGSSQSKGRAIVNLLSMQSGEEVSNFLAIPEDSENATNLIFSTKNGMIRRSDLNDFLNVNANGKIAITLNEGDSLVNVRIANNDQHILLASKAGQAIRFPVEIIRVIKSRASQGVTGMKLANGDDVVSLSIINNQGNVAEEDLEKFLSISHSTRAKILTMESNKLENLANTSALNTETLLILAQKEEFLLTITENGFGKRTSTHEYRITNRGGKGVKNIITSKRNGFVKASFIAQNNNDIIISASSGKGVRCNAETISITGRSAQGVKIIALTPEDKVISVVKVDKSDVEDSGDEVQDEN
ncbi:MAG: DNA gyrase subunit A [Candidatus Deianiraeaceae bacterium]|jgi:DNA gyrase subunit A